jgi:hypothetical protein
MLVLGCMLKSHARNGNKFQTPRHRGSAANAEILGFEILVNPKLIWNSWKLACCHGAASTCHGNFLSHLGKVWVYASHKPELLTTSMMVPWWYVFVTVGHVFCQACTSMTILWQNQDSHTCAVVEVFHDNIKIIITEVSTSMTINGASWKCFRQGWPTRGTHRNGSPLCYRVRFWIRQPVNNPDQCGFSTCKILIGRSNHVSAPC